MGITREFNDMQLKKLSPKIQINAVFEIPQTLGFFFSDERGRGGWKENSLDIFSQLVNVIS